MIEFPKLTNFSFRENVKLSPAIKRSLECLDKHFHGEQSWISSGVRTPWDQIRIILKKISAHGINKEFEEINLNLTNGVEHQIEIDGIKYYWWQRGWSKLLSIGDIVNPPVPAVVLFDYFRPGSSKNKKGELINLSPHQKGLSFDIEGDNNLLEKAKRVMNAFQEKDSFITAYLVERVNNAVHVDVQQIG